MNRDLMLAVLSLHTYSDDPAFNQIGNAVVSKRAEEGSGFYANAYTYNGEKIISYRGTSTSSVSDFITDAWNAYQTGIGLGSTQAGLAAAFYRDVVGANQTMSANVTFTGHSLGGGLAGLMAGLYGQHAVMFNNMAFRDAAAWTYYHATTPEIDMGIDPLTGQPRLDEPNPLYQLVRDAFYTGVGPVAPNFSGISGYRMDGQFLNFQSEGQTVGSNSNWGLGSFALHSQALLVVNMFSELKYGVDPAWKPVGYLLGGQFLQLNDGGTRIAYSVVDEGTMPNGDAAVRSMFDDAVDIAQFEALQASVYWRYADGLATQLQLFGQDAMAPLTGIAVEFADSQAQAKIERSDEDHEGEGTFHVGGQGLFLALEETAKSNSWNDVKTIVKMSLESESGKALSQSAQDTLSAVGFVVFSEGGSVDLDNAELNPLTETGQLAEGENTGALVFGTDDVDVIKGGKGDDFLIGGGGADTLIGGDGKDALFGGDGADIIIAGTLAGDGIGEDSFESETIAGGSQSDYIVIGKDGAKKFVLSGGDANDRILIHADMVGFESARSTESFQMLTLLGATDHRLFYPKELNSSFSEDELGKFRQYTVNIADLEAAPGDTYHEWYVNGGWKSSENREIPGGSIIYRHYPELSLLTIVLQTETETEIQITDYQIGDYGIKLVGPLFTHIFETVTDDPKRSFVVSPWSGKDMLAYGRFYADILSKSDEISLTEGGAIAQRSFQTPQFTPSINVVFTGEEANDSLLGNDVSETYNGLAGDDLINSSGGDDRVFGGDGADRLIGGQGADLLDGGAGVDTADYRTSTAAVVVNLVAQIGTGGDAEGDTLVLIENLAGSQFGDVLSGDDTVNRLQGFAGNDQLLGAGGNDRLLGGLGADVINGGDGVDTADYSTSLLAVTVNLKLNSGQGADAEGDTFIAIENLSGSDFGDSLTGDDLNNRLSGVDGNDVLSGLGGIDYLVGGNGNDTMTGGTGADVFVFNLGSGADTITDFWAGTGRTDRIQFVDGQFANFADVLAQASDTASGIIIQIDADDSLTLSGLQISALRGDDFLFT